MRNLRPGVGFTPSLPHPWWDIHFCSVQ